MPNKGENLIDPRLLTESGLEDQRHKVGLAVKEGRQAGVDVRGYLSRLDHEIERRAALKEAESNGN